MELKASYSIAIKTVIVVAGIPGCRASLSSHLQGKHNAVSRKSKFHKSLTMLDVHVMQTFQTVEQLQSLQKVLNALNGVVGS